MAASLRVLVLFTLFTVGTNCQRVSEKTQDGLQKYLSGLSMQKGRPEYLSSPFVTAGDRVYMVGFQNGSFPPLGWHITGEMGGIWDHPIKLLDGFDASITTDDGASAFCLNNADSFSNYPLGNVHHFTWRDQGIDAERFQFVPDGVEGMVIEFLIRNNNTAARQLDFAINANFDLRPTWLGERTQMKDDVDEVQFLPADNAFLAKDKSNPWFAVFGSNAKPSTYSFENMACLKGAPEQGRGASLSYHLSLPPKSETRVPIYIAGSYHSRSSAMATFFKLRATAASKLQNKVSRYDSIRNLSRIEVPDTTIRQMLEWVKYSNDWLIREVPELGRGLSAGVPDYPWWFGCDSEYALQGVLATGQHALVKSSILLLKKISDKTNGNGRIIHEVSTNGAVYNAGNTNETAQFVSLLWNYYEWTGDLDFIQQLYPDVVKGIHWLLIEKDPDHNLFPNGGGMVEIAGLDSEMIDVAVYTQQALEAAARISAVVQENANQRDYFEKSVKLKKLINTVWWVSEDEAFADFISTKPKAIALVEAAIVRADTLKKTAAVKELRERLQRIKASSAQASKGYTVFHNAVVNSPMEVGVADPEKAKSALKSARRYRNYFGAYVTGIDKGDDDVDSVVEKSRKKTFNYTGAVMTLPTGVLAIAEARYGNSDEALEYLKRLGHTFNYALPGSMYEVSPDFGMMAQAWNIYAVAVPVISYFFGVQPSAAESLVTFRPALPHEWKKASLHNLIVGKNSVSIAIDLKEGVSTYEFSQTLPDWKLKLRVSGNSVSVNGKSVKTEITNGESYVTMGGGTNFVVEVRDAGK